MENETKNSTINIHMNFVIPKRSIWSFFALLGSIIFTYFQAIGYLLPGYQEIANLNENLSINDLGLMWVPVIMYLLIGLNVSLFVNIFKKLKRFEEKGLIGALTFGLIVGLIGGFVGGLIFAFIDGLTIGLIFGLIGTLTFGLIFGLTLGLIGEFKK